MANPIVELGRDVPVIKEQTLLGRRALETARAALTQRFLDAFNIGDLKHASFGGGGIFPQFEYKRNSPHDSSLEIAWVTPEFGVHHARAISSTHNGVIVHCDRGTEYYWVARQPKNSIEAVDSFNKLLDILLPNQNFQS